MATLLSRISDRVKRVGRDHGVVPQVVVIPVKERKRLQREFMSAVKNGGGYSDLATLNFIEGAKIVWSPLTRKAVVF